jgi:hypothetical protein
MAKDTIVKIQKALFPPHSPALIYDHHRTIMIHEPFEELPAEVRSALNDAPKVYWRVRMIGSRLDFRDRTEDQSW